MELQFFFTNSFIINVTKTISEFIVFINIKEANANLAKFLLKNKIN